MMVPRILITLFLMFMTICLFADEVGTIKSNLNLRSEPSITGDKVTVLQKDDKVNVLEEKEGWYKIETNKGVTGWASGKYIAFATPKVKKDTTTSDVIIRPEPSKDDNLLALTMDDDEDDEDIFSLPSEVGKDEYKASEIDQPLSKLPENTRILDGMPLPEQPLASGDKDFASGYDIPESAQKREEDIKIAREGIPNTFYKYYEERYPEKYFELQMYYKGESKEQDIKERKRRLQKYYKVFYEKNDVDHKRPLREILYEDYIKKQVTTYKYDDKEGSEDVTPQTLVIVKYRGDKEGQEEEYLIESYTYDLNNRLANVRYYEPYADVLRPDRISFYNEAGQIYFSIAFNKEGVREKEKYLQNGIVKEIHYFDAAKAPKAGGPFRIEKFYSELDLIKKVKKNYSFYLGNQKSIAEYVKKGVKADDITKPVFYPLSTTKCNRIYQRDFTIDGHLKRVTVYYLDDNDVIEEKKMTEWNHVYVEVVEEERAEGEEEESDVYPGASYDDYEDKGVKKKLIYRETFTKRYNKKGEEIVGSQCACEDKVSSQAVVSQKIISNPRYYAVDKDGLIDKHVVYKNMHEAQTFRNFYLVYFKRTSDKNKGIEFRPFTSLQRSKELIGTMQPSSDILEWDLNCPAWVVNDWKVDFMVYYQDNQIERIVYYNNDSKIFRIDFYSFDPNNEQDTKQNPYRYMYHFYGGSKNRIIEEIVFSNHADARETLDYITYFRDDGRVDHRNLYHGDETYADSSELIAENSFVKRKIRKITDWAVLKKSQRHIYGRNIFNEVDDKLSGMITQEIIFDQNVPVKNIFYKYTTNGREVLKEEKIQNVETSEYEGY